VSSGDSDLNEENARIPQHLFFLDFQKVD
jgi:hypothetical protein